jgi:hypothetical protein
VWFTSTSTQIDVVWTATDSVASPDVAGYNVYRSATSGSGHVKQNFELLRTGTRYSDEGLSLGSTFFYYVTAVDESGNESVASAEIQGWTTQVQVPGWPQATSNFNYPGITMADADSNGTGEIYLGSHDFDFHGWDYDASFLDGFPVTTFFEVWSTAACVDMDQDGDQELFFGGRDARAYAVNADGSPYYGSSPFFADLSGTGAGIRSAVTVADVDDDGNFEILFGTDIGTVYGFNHDATPLNGGTGLLFTCQGGASASIWGTLAVADFDKDGTKEIAFASWNDSLYVINSLGVKEPGFPRGAGGDFRGGVTAGDLDHDGTLELLAGSFDGNLYAYNHDGSNYVSGGILGSAGAAFGGSVTLANLDADPQLEVLAGNFDGNLYAYNHDGSSFLAGQGGLFADLPLGAGVNDGIVAGPIVVDVDGDSDFEIFVGHRNKNFYGFHHDGSTVIGLPIPTGDRIFGSAAAGDLDGDGGVDIAFASYDATVNVLDFSGASTPAAYEWPTQGMNNLRTGVYGDLGPVVSSPSGLPRPVPVFGLRQNMPNPFGSGTAIEFSVPETQRVTLAVFNISGRLVRTLVDGEVPAGPSQVRWDGRDGGGNPLASGIYFYRLENGERTITRKGVLLR